MASSETKIDGVVIVQMSATGSSYLTPALMYGGLTGSLQKLTSGLSYLVAGANVTIASQSNGQVVISAASSGGSDSNAGESGLYGTGYDGSATLDGTNTFSWASKSSNEYSLTCDVYLSSLTIVSGSIFKTKGYRVFVDGACTVTSGTIENSASSWTGASAGSLAGGANGNPSAAGSTGDLGAAGGLGSGGTYAGGTVTGRGPRSLPFALEMYVPDPAAPGIVPIKPGASGGAGSLGARGGGGGGFVVLVAKSITLASGGAIKANGGDGVNDGNSAGGGGGGGVVVLVSQTTVVNSGSIQANGGVLLTGWGGVAPYAGSSGSIMQFVAR